MPERRNRSSRLALAVPVALAVPAVLVACGGSTGRSAEAPSTSPARAGGTATAGTATAGAARVGSGAVRVVADGLRVPWGLAFLPDSSALVGERPTGRVLRIPAGGGRPTEVMHLTEAVAYGEGGLLGLAVSPHYATDGLLYAYYTTSTDNRIARFRLGGPVQPILTGIARGTNHDGGRIAFGPDGMLYAGVGDAGNRANAQDLTKLNGKILRMRPDGSVPADNPFPGSRVYSLGHRNVQGLAWDSAGRLWATEFGQNRFDEVNLIIRGSNYGWPVVEGHGGDDRFREPLVTWTTDQASPSGAAIIGDTLYVGALRGQRLWEVPLKGASVGTPTALLQGRYGRLRTVVAAPDGSLWVTTSNQDGRGTPQPGDDKILRLS